MTHVSVLVVSLRARSCLLRRHGQRDLRPGTSKTKAMLANGHVLLDGMSRLRTGLDEALLQVRFEAG